VAGNGIDFLAEAVHHGVTFDPGRLFQPGTRAGKLAMRVCFSGVRAKDLEEGARRLGRAWQAYARSAGRSAR
jgi:DNA-binding transcriptional MocR family regulator